MKKNPMRACLDCPWMFRSSDLNCPECGAPAEPLDEPDREEDEG